MEEALQYDECYLEYYYYQQEGHEAWRTECPLGHLADIMCAKPFDDDNLTYRYPEGDVVLSLAPWETDNLLLPRKLLEKKSPFFGVALSERWLSASGREDSNEPIRFELVYDEDGGSSLVQKVELNDRDYFRGRRTDVVLALRHPVASTLALRQ